MKKCIWCGRGQKEVSFDTIAHIVPKSLGGKETCDDVCDDCNHYFGTAPRGTNGIPCMDHAFKEIFGAIRMFSQNLNSESYKKFRTTYFTYKHSQRLVKIKHNFDSKKITHQFKRALYEVFFQKYHSVTGDGHNTQFKMIKDYARYNIGNPHVFYAIWASSSDSLTMASKTSSSSMEKTLVMAATNSRMACQILSLIVSSWLS